VQRRANFRTHNGELPLQQQYLARLQAAGVVPLYVPNGIAEETTMGDATSSDDLSAPTAGSSTAATASLPPLPLPPPLVSPALSLVSLRADLARTLQMPQCRTPIDWSLLPSSIVPATHMNAARAHRKQDQLQNMINALRALLAHMEPQRFEEDQTPIAAATQSTDAAAPSPSRRRRPTVVDFCCGSGHLGFPVAFLFPWVDVVLLEWNATAIARAHARLAELRSSTGLAWANVRIVHAGLQELDEAFDVGIGIHACGWLSGVIQIKCFQHRAAFLLAPCCIGKLRLGEGREITLPEGAAAQRITATPAMAAAAEGAGGVAAPCCASAARADSSSTGGLTMLHYPRSSVYTSLLLRDEYLLLASKADYSDERWNFASAASSAGSRYKSFIEWDRSVGARARRCHHNFGGCC
jgi:hypothetical protein